MAVSHMHELDVDPIAGVGINEPRDSLPARASELDLHPYRRVVDPLRPLHTLDTERLILRRVRVLRRGPLVLRHERQGTSNR